MTEKKHNSVRILGAGVAALTVAHELAERGFQVYVYDKQRDPRRPNEPLAGGLAATQYRRWPAPVGTRRRVPGNESLRAAPPLLDFRMPELELDGRWPIVPLSATRRTIDAIAAVLDEQLVARSPTEHEQISVIARSSNDANAIRDAIAAALATRLMAAPHSRTRWKLVDSNDGRRCFVHANEDRSPFDAQGSFAQIWINAVEWARAPLSAAVVYVSEVLLAGEHGYRFFPSFYRNLFDTLKRIPFLENAVADEWREAALSPFGEATYEKPRRHRVTGETVYDRLVALTRHAIATTDGRPPLELPRTAARSVAAAGTALEATMERTGLTGSDLSRTQLTMLRYATSCAARRQEYEHTSWRSFAGGPAGSEAFQRAMRHWPRALVGLGSDRADARSFGSVQLQLLVDQMHGEGLRDGSLDAPTSEAWLDAWKRYLQDHLGVHFGVDEVTELSETDDGKIKVATTGGHADDPSWYHVIALDLPALLELPGARNAERPGPIGALGRLAGCFRREKILGRARVGERSDDDPFADFSGIQFFLEEDHHVLRGHIYYPDSAWGLTSVSPMSYRRDRPDAQARAAGLVSVVIGDWDSFDGDPAHGGMRARECDPDMLAKRVWKQIWLALRHSETAPPEVPLAYHIDRGLQWRETSPIEPGRPSTWSWVNETPFLVNDWRLADWWPEEAGRYRVHDDRVVFAGTWLSTRTRLVTMEAACESGRHAANAILEHYAASTENAAYARVPTFDIEELEPPELDWLRRLDAELHTRGVPHVLDVLGTEELLRDLDHRGDLGRQLTELAQESHAVGSALGDALRDAITRLLPEALRRWR